LPLEDWLGEVLLVFSLVLFALFSPFLFLAEWCFPLHQTLLRMELLEQLNSHPQKIFVELLLHHHQPLLVRRQCFHYYMRGGI
jgi:hypothetical protein